MIPALIGAGASLLGGLINRNSAKDAQAAQAAHNAQQIALQKEFAQNGIQWKAADAKAAGIHPLYALGASTPTFSPVSASFTADTSMGNALASAGQDIGRAVNATRTEPQRVAAFTNAMQALQLERGSLENEVLRADLASKTGRLRTQLNPPMAGPGSNYLIPGQTQSGLVKDEPHKRVGADPSNPHSEPGAITDVGWARTAGGGLMPVPSKDVKERIEDNWYHETGHFMRNNIFPMLQTGTPPYKAPPGQRWYFDPIDGYKLTKDSDFKNSVDKLGRYMSYIGRR